MLREFLMHLVVKRFVDTFVQFLKLTHFATALLPQWTVFTVALATRIGFLRVAFTVCSDAFEW